MNTQEEIKAQFQFNCFGKLYAYLSSALLRWGGAKGERIVRESVALYAQEKGEQIRRHQAEAGVAVDLKNLFRAEPCCGADPRFYRVTLRDTKQAQLQEVYSCPLAKQWADLDATFAGTLYCEEYAHALIRGYTSGKGQANVANSLTCSRDNRCVLAFYYRTANMTPQQKKAFEDGTCASPEWNTGRSILQLYHAFYRCAAEQGTDGLAALAQGLRAFTQDILSALPDQADRAGWVVDTAFMDAFFPLPYTQKAFDSMTSCLEESEKEIFYINVIQQIQAAFVLQE